MTPFEIQPEIENSHQVSFLTLSKAEKITALWALSESTLGGLLHTLKLPFRGMIISSAAIILIGMIAKFSDKRGQIIKSALLVIFIKAAISPYTPAALYLSVLLQGLLGEFLFFSKRITLIPAIILGIIVSLLNGFQRVIVLTLIYGETLWRSIDKLLNIIAKDWLLFNLNNKINFSLVLIFLYVGMHLIIGITAGIFAYIIPRKVENKLKEATILIPINELPLFNQNYKKLKRRKWLKPSAVIILIASIILVVVSYFYPLSNRVFVNDLLIMIGRSILIMSLWFFIIAPRVKNYLNKYFNKKQNRYVKEINLFLSSMSSLKGVISISWMSSSKHKGIKRLYLFTITTLLYLLKDYKLN